MPTGQVKCVGFFAQERADGWNWGRKTGRVAERDKRRETEAWTNMGQEDGEDRMEERTWRNS